MTYLPIGRQPRTRVGLAGVSVPTPTGWTSVTPAAGDTFRSVGHGDASKLLTAKLVASLAKAQQFDPIVLDTAQQLAMTVPPRDVDGICYAIRGFLARNFHFVEDTRDADAVREPAKQLALYYNGLGMRGDCDCIACLGLALALAVGRDGRLVLVAFRSPAEEYTHIYAEIAGVDWVDLDVTKPAGLTPRVARTTVVDV
jgi:hypothetical protein